MDYQLTTQDQTMLGLGPMELLIIGFAVATIAGYAWSTTDAKNGSYEPKARSFRIGVIAAMITAATIVALSYSFPSLIPAAMAGCGMSFVIGALGARAGYAIGPASQESKNAAGQRLNDHVNAAAVPRTETGNPYQPPIVADPDHVAKDRT